MPAGSETSEKSSSELSAKGSLNSKADDDDSNQKQNSVQLCTEVFDEHSSPTEDGKFIIKNQNIILRFSNIRCQNFRGLCKSTDLELKFIGVRVVVPFPDCSYQ